jgi:hypothetical protein
VSGVSHASYIADDAAHLPEWFEFCHSLGKRGRVEVGDDDARALLEKEPSNGISNTGCSSRDQC